MIMKKVVLTLVAMMAMTSGFAKSNESKRFDMSCDIYRLSVVLDLDDEQMDAVEMIQDNFSNEMQSLASQKGFWQRANIHKAVRKDAEQMRKVLNDEQFNAYMRILIATLHNRNL